MKKMLIILCIAMGIGLQAQSIDYNTKKGFAVNGYDVVSYFKDTVQRGKEKFIAEYEGIQYKFSSQENLEAFRQMPQNYIPQYGGYCAYAIATKSKKVAIDPNTFEIRKGKLYLFYNAWGNNTLQSWLNESPEKLKQKADKNWTVIKHAKH